MNKSAPDASKQAYRTLTEMKRHALKFAAILLPVFGGVSCMTTYDAYGRPVQSVDPGAAAAGVAAAGLIGYAIGQNNERDHHHHYHHHRPRRGYYHY